MLMNLKFCKRFVALYLAALLQQAFAAQSIDVCLSDNNLPPFAYRAEGHQLPPRYQGVAVDILQRALPSSDYHLNIKSMPWRRCLRNIQAGLVHIAINAFESESDKWLASVPYFELHNIYLYSRRQFKHAPPVKPGSFPGRYHLCGLTTRDEARYKLGITRFDDGALNFRALVAKLHAGHCDLALESRESLAGLFLLDSSLKTLIQDPDLDEMPLSDTPLSPLRFLIAHRAPEASQLQQHINETIRALQADKNGIVRRVNDYLR